MLTMQIQAGAPLITSPGSTGTTTAHSTPRRLLYLALVVVAVPVYVADQLTKAWATANLQPDQPRSLIGSVLRLNLIRNSGAAFSIGTGATWLLTAIAGAVVVFVLFSARRLGSRGWALALGLLLGGSLGNLTDRMFRAPGPGRGHVVDFVQLPHFAIFNVADSAIVSAAVLIAFMAFRGIGIDGVRVTAGKHEEGRPEEGKHEGHQPDVKTPEEGAPGDDGPRDDRSGSDRPEIQAADQHVAQQLPKPSTGIDHDV